LCSGRFVNEEGDVAILFEGEVNEPVTLVHGMTSETLAEEDVPVGLPLVVHMLLYNARNLTHKFKLVTAPRLYEVAYLYTIHFKLVVVKRLFSNLDNFF